jgi:uncharacterized protein YndB with AHSA1/START domain
MPADISAKPTGLVIDEATHTLRFTRTFDAPPAMVFEAWTNPDQMRCWWDPDGVPLVVCEIDLRPGGRFAFATANHIDRPFSGIYREIDPPSRLVFEALQSTGRVLLQRVEGKTRMVVEIQCGSAEHLAQFVQMGVANGTSRTLDNLVAYIQRQGVTA